MINDLIKTGLIFTAGVLTTWALANNNIKNKEIKNLKSELYQAKVIAVEIFKAKENAFDMVWSLNEELTSVMNENEQLLRQNQLIKDLRSVNNKELILALAFTESSLNYDVKHKGDKAKGICGVIPIYWNDLLKEHKVKVNSLKSCEIILNHLLDKNNGDLVNALVDYKGIKSKDNIELAYRVLEIYKDIK